jgi:enoyl-CoA hydratase/carnithine racemase
MEPESHLLVERRDGIMILTMNRPEVKNSLSPQMLVRLAAAWHEFRDSRELRVAILTGAGDEDFCAGASRSSPAPETRTSVRAATSSSPCPSSPVRGSPRTSGTRS